MEVKASKKNENKMLRLERQPRYTIREVAGGPSEVQQDAWDAICSSVARAMDALDLRGHLFVTVIGADIIRTGYGDDECGFGLYHSGMQHVAVCGGDGPPDLKDDRAEWIRQIKLSTTHEIIHYYQELQCTLGDSEETELEAERMAEEIVAESTS